MIVIVFSFLFAALFSFISIVVLVNAFNSYGDYVSAKYQWAKNIGAKYRDKLNNARLKLVCDVVLFICLISEALMFCISFVLSIYLRLNP